ncbi:hypothetical protein GOP47_0018356 [Adiantum capillus-veneris]|uniref:SAM domain-containing protein n=1 Tax=Adiantum capillus-veneris TaxID=13818 RepID=A0A9D4UH46_ADICA|nr:hypothetical protein GOP47_0018356 [Adiantum capillus-veneris]
MWNKAAQKVWKEANQEFIAEKPAVASSSEAPGNHLGPKRQRRPSVRLEDIGDRPAAVLAEKKRKKIVFFASSVDACPGKRTPKLDPDEALENTSKVLKVRSLVNVNNGNTHGCDSSHDDGDLERQTVRHSELESPCRSAPVECWQQEAQPALCDVTEVIAPSHFLKPVSKKGRNGNRRRGGPKAAISVKQFTSSGPSVTAQREPHIKDGIDVHSEEENEARTPEGFRDCDLETSDYFNDAKDLSNSLESKPSSNGDMSPLRGEQESQFRRAYENGSSRHDHGLAERDEHVPASQQVAEESLSKLNKEFIDRNKEGGVSTGVWTEAANKAQAYVVDSPKSEEANRVPFANKVKFSEKQESREPPSNNAELHFAKRHPPLLHGVRGWLQNLGLGKYAQQFEAHEVDIEVLPLLTFDDLKEMGITAVGSRRKLFFAIQQLGKCLLVKAD